MTSTPELITPPELLASEAFDILDREFATLLLRLAEGQPPPSLAVAAALVSRATRDGHVCLNLKELANAPESSRAQGGPALTLDQWRTELAATSVVGQPGEFKPLILDPAGRLYLQRYWNYETIVTNAIRERISTRRASVERSAPEQSPTVEILNRYFPPTSPTLMDGQRIAVGTAMRDRFCVISGGPGTGKTYTIAVLVAALLESHGEPGPRIALAAPTGKAAIRLQEALQHAREHLPCPAPIRARLPVATSTLHRLLGSIPGSPRFRHNAENFLPYDLIIIDEASMIDLALMARVFLACRPETRVVLVGDMDQLASVEAGAVLGDICEGVRGPQTVQTESDLGPSSSAASHPLAGVIVPLRGNRRFRDDAGIAPLSRALNQGDSATALQLLRSDPTGALGTLPVSTGEPLARLLFERVGELFHKIVAAPSPADALQYLADFRVLCALRRGPHGVETLNQAVEKRLRESGLVSSSTPFFPGRPILIVKNDYNLRLFNGDVGVVWPHPQSGELRVWFRDAEGNDRDFAPGRLPEHETVFAMTVHKSQGSEFQRVLIILPERDSPVLTRELIYTGVTRARSHVEIWLEETTFTAALARRTRRTSGLSERLWSPMNNAK